MEYNQQDLVIRLKALLPIRWFGESAPVLDAVLQGLASGWTGLLTLLSFMNQQSRIGTAIGPWLDLAGHDYVGHQITRGPGEEDNTFRRRLKVELAADKCTREAVTRFLINLTGRYPLVVEPFNTGDTGCYGGSGSFAATPMGYGIAGRFGNLDLPFQAFITAYRPINPGVAMVSGWGIGTGSFGGGSSAFTDISTSVGQITDREIFHGIARTTPAGCKMWVAVAP